MFTVNIMKNRSAGTSLLTDHQHFIVVEPTDDKHLCVMDTAYDFKVNCEKVSNEEK